MDVAPLGPYLLQGENGRQTEAPPNQEMKITSQRIKYAINQPSRNMNTNQFVQHFLILYDQLRIT